MRVLVDGTAPGRVVSEDGLARDSGDAGNAAVRAELIDGIRGRRAEFEDAGQRSEELRELPAETVRTLREMGVFWLKTPSEFGGTLLTPLEFCDVMEELGYADTSTAWVTMVGNGGAGTAAGWLPDAGGRRVFGPAARRRSSSGCRGRPARDGRWRAVTW